MSDDSGIPSADDVFNSIYAYINDPNAAQPSSSRPVKLGVVDAAYTGTGNAKVLFDGETVAGTRAYVPLVPVRAGDRVVLVPVGRSYVILGAIGGSSPIGDPVGTVIEGRWAAAPTGYLLENGSAVSRTTYAALFDCLNPVVGTFTVTIATPGVFTLNAHGMKDGQKVYLTTTGALPTGLAVNTAYFVTSSAANTFRLSATLGGAAINTTGSQSGTHTVKKTYGVGNGSTTFNVPDSRGRVLVSLSTDTEFDALGDQGGVKTHTLVAAEIPVLNAFTRAWNNSGTAVSTDNSSTALPRAWYGANNDRQDPYINTTGGGAHNNLQPYDTIQRAIKW